MQVFEAVNVTVMIGQGPGKPAERRTAAVEPACGKEEYDRAVLAAQTAGAGVLQPQAARAAVSSGGGALHISPIVRPVDLFKSTSSLFARFCLYIR
jgi:hypothetical protein